VDVNESVAVGVDVTVGGIAVTVDVAVDVTLAV
jgi:hypothetical protein